MKTKIRRGIVRSGHNEKGKSTTPTCLACGKKAIGRFTPDADVIGVAFCAKHKEILKFDLLLALLDKKCEKEFIKKYYGKNKA